MKIAKQVEPLRQVDPMGEGIRDAVLFLSATSLTIVMRRLVEIPPWLGFLVKRAARLVGMISGWGAARETRERLSLGENAAWPNAPSPSPSRRRDELTRPDGCPATGVVSSEPQDGVRGRRT